MLSYRLEMMSAVESGSCGIEVHSRMIAVWFEASCLTSLRLCSLLVEQSDLVSLKTGI